MTTERAIAKANELRLNALDDAQKAGWLYELEGKLAEMMELPVPENIWPENAELQMPTPYDNIYELYLVALIDYYNGETDLYANDMALYDQALAEGMAWWRRTHRPENSGNWRVM